jgi:hypothetical protein
VVHGSSEKVKHSDVHTLFLHQFVAKFFITFEEVLQMWLNSLDLSRYGERVPLRQCHLLHSVSDCAW